MDDNFENAKIKNLYNKQIKEKYKDNYELKRWFSTSRLRLDYFMTYNSINNRLQEINYSNCIEFGPGPGTWTRLLYRNNVDANFDLIDISKEMKNQFALEMREKDNINYFVSDINEYKFTKKYDLFFSSRAVEYVEDKNKLFKKIYDILDEGGKGVIITKNPEFGIFRKIKSKKWHHKKQIRIKDFDTALSKLGFKDIKTYPVIVRISFIDRFFINLSEFVYKKVFNKKITKSILPFTESYLIAFKK